MKLELKLCQMYSVLESAWIFYFEFFGFHKSPPRILNDSTLVLV
jgi:hypothetical protein